MTIWFKIILAVLFLAVLYRVYYIRRLSNKSFSTKLGRLVDEGTNQLRTENEQHKLFRIEDTISKTGTMGKEVTGLGLLLCKEFVEKSGGTICAESELTK